MLWPPLLLLLLLHKSLEVCVADASHKLVSLICFMGLPHVHAQEMMSCARARPRNLAAREWPPVCTAAASRQQAHGSAPVGQPAGEIRMRRAVERLGTSTRQAGAPVRSSMRSLAGAFGDDERPMRID